jgi:hypothetical protein
MLRAYGAFKALPPPRLNIYLSSSVISSHSSLWTDTTVLCQVSYYPHRKKSCLLSSHTLNFVNAIQPVMLRDLDSAPDLKARQDEGYHLPRSGRLREVVLSTDCTVERLAMLGFLMCDEPLVG